MKENNLITFFNNYIKGTSYKALVLDYKVSLCVFKMYSVKITTRSLKHLYDKKPAEEFDFLLNNLVLIVEDPEQIYKNKSGKHGDICLSKSMGEFEYLCSLEKISRNEFQVVTAFRLRDESYIKNYTILWNRGSGKPHRHAIEFLEEFIDAPQ